MLHELDIYMEKLKLLREAASLGHKPTTRNPLYSSASNTIRKCVKLRARTDLSKDSRKQIHSLLYAALRLRKRTRSELRNPGHSKIDYVRYADDWLVGVWGPKSLANLRHNIGSFLQSLGLALSEEKTLITNTRRGKVKFLGTLIKRIAPTRGSPTRAAGNLWLTAPLSILAKRLRDKGFWKPGPNGPIALGITEFIPLPVKDMILRYRTILAGFLNYYSFADNIGSLIYIYHLLRQSLRNTICRKYDMSARKFLATYGQNITIRIKKKDGKWVNLDFPPPKLIRSPNNFQGTLPRILWESRTERSRRSRLWAKTVPIVEATRISKTT